MLWRHYQSNGNSNYFFKALEAQESAEPDHPEIETANKINPYDFLPTNLSYW